MMNPLEAHAHAGTKAGTAQRHHDSATARHWHDWHRAAARLEKPEDAAAARAAYAEAYRAVSANNQPQYFR
jgi:hypothetical protein